MSGQNAFENVLNLLDLSPFHKCTTRKRHSGGNVVGMPRSFRPLYELQLVIEEAAEGAQSLETFGVASIGLAPDTKLDKLYFIIQFRVIVFLSA